MIVSESDTLVAALDRRLAVDRILALDSLVAVDPEAAAPRTTSSPSNAAPGLAPAATGRPAGDVPLAPGTVVAARVVDVPAPDHLLVDIGRIRVALAWPAVNGPTPAIGRDVPLRVVADAPMLVFETLLDDPLDGGSTGAPARLSIDARRLQASSSPLNAPTRFSAPILTVEAADETVRPMPTGDLAVVVATPDTIVQAPPDAVMALPLVLQGPAWPGRDVEIVVRRERADEAFDNAALDQWCGELVIELPRLGRVSGHLAWSLQGLRIRVEGADDSSTGSLSAGSAELAAALVDAELPVLSVTVGRPVASMPDGGRRG